MADERHIYIEQPEKFKGEITVNMGDKGKEDCPVSIRFKPDPAHLVHHTEKPIDVNMRMSFDDCFRIGLCKPICAKSDYEIGLKFFNREVGTISVRGLTRLHNCDETPDLLCIGFDEVPLERMLKAGQAFHFHGYTFTPAGGTAMFYHGGSYLPDKNKLWIHAKLRIDLPQPADVVRLGLCNYGSPQVGIRVFAGGTLVGQYVETVDNTYREITLNHPGMTAVVVFQIKESRLALVEICYAATKPVTTHVETPSLTHLDQPEQANPEQDEESTNEPERANKAKKR